MVDQLHNCRRGVPSCTGRVLVPHVQQSNRKSFRYSRRRQQRVACDAGWTEAIADGLYTLSSSVQNASNFLATVSPQFVQPTVTTLGDDLATAIALHPTWQGLSRLGVGSMLTSYSAYYDTQHF